MRDFLLIALSFFIALVLVIIPIPEWAVWYRPDWVLLVLIYWALDLPHRMGLLAAWLLGLFVDLLQPSLLGEHALIYVVIVYLIFKFQPRIRLFPIWQQALIVFLLLLFAEIIQFWVEGLLGVTAHWQYWLTPFLSTIIWPWVYVILRDYRRRYRVY